MHIQYDYIYIWRIPLAFPLPLLVPLCVPFYLLGTLQL
jgi:hypothetical protein